MIGIVTGGTGGHLFPAQALAEDLQQEGIPILFFGNRLEQNRYFQRQYFPFVTIPSAPLPLSKPHKLPKNLWTLWKGFRLARRLLKKHKPALLVSFGSYHTFPTLLAAVTLGIPFILFEADRVPGTVTRTFARFAKRIATHFPSVKMGHPVEWAEMPLRKELRRGRTTREKACERYGFASKYPVLLILGGSQGAKGINKQVQRILQEGNWPYPNNVQVLHLTGREEDVEGLQKAYGKQGIRCWVASFESSMEYGWEIADLAWCRAGALTLAEALEFEVPSLFIPYPHGTRRHQHHNADFFATEVKGGFWMEEASASKQPFLNVAKQLWDEKKALRESIRSYKENQHPQPLLDIVKELWSTKT